MLRRGLQAARSRRREMRAQTHSLGASSDGDAVGVVLLALAGVCAAAGRRGVLPLSRGFVLLLRRRRLIQAVVGDGIGSVLPATTGSSCCWWRWGCVMRVALGGLHCRQHRGICATAGGGIVGYCADRSGRNRSRPAEAGPGDVGAFTSSSTIISSPAMCIGAVGDCRRAIQANVSPKILIRVS